MDDGHENRMLRAFLMENDVPCPECGYVLRDLQVNLCPECGSEFSIGKLDPEHVSDEVLAMAKTLHTLNMLSIGVCMLLTGFMAALRLGAGGTWGFSPELVFLMCVGMLVFELCAVRRLVLESKYYALLFNPIGVFVSVVVVSVATSLLGFL